MKMYELMPADGRKSFYGKAKVVIDDNGNETLISYETPVVRRNKQTGELIRLWSGWSATTGRHINAFCGLYKKEYMALPYRGKKPGELTPDQSLKIMLARRNAR